MKFGHAVLVNFLDFSDPIPLRLKSEYVAKWLPFKEVAAPYLSKTSQIIFDLHPGFFHMEDEKGNKLHLFKKYFKMMFFLLYKSSLILVVIHFLCDESFCKGKLK